MPSCPSCRREWPEGREVCGDCLASLVDDLGATIDCPECGRSAPARMHSCPGCLALLRPGEVDLTEDVTRMLSRGMRMHRPAGRAPFASGLACSVLRLHPQSPLVVCGGDGLIEANLAGPGVAARAPLTCTTDGEVLFRLETYSAASDALVALGGDGASLATFLRRGSIVAPTLEVRDETSAPVARLVGSQLVETGGDVLASVSCADVEQDLWLDDQWSLDPRRGAELPLQPMGVIALVVAAKVLLGRPVPVRIRPEEREDDEERSDVDDVLGPIGRSIVDGFFT
jgi:hypothetical protein